MKLPFKEPIAPRYIYINPNTNVVHLLIPIMSGTEIGLDNTCKSVYSLQEFFGLAGANKQSDALSELTRYKEALEFDLKYLPESNKKARLSQINSYLTLLRSIQEDKQIIEPLKQEFPIYPAPIESLMQTKEANLYSIILRPKVEDVMLRTTAISPVFSVNHSRLENGQVIPKASLLYITLANSYSDVSFHPKSKKQLIARVIAKLADSPVNFEQIRAMLSAEIHEYLDLEIDFNQTQGLIPMNQAYLDEQLAASEDNPATHLEYLNGLIEYCVPKLLDGTEGSPFYTMDNQERLSILTQFFLAELNISCRAENITKADFGQILEKDVRLMQGLAEEVKKALARNASVEDALIAYINQHQQKFQLVSPINQNQIEGIKTHFKSHYEHIKDSPHFDEFMLLSKKNGLFVTHQSSIVTHFAHFMQTGFFELDESTQEFLQQAQEDFKTVDKSDNVIPHKNGFVEAEAIQLNLAPMDNHSLQALYKHIHSYADPKLKAELLTQLQQERPDFKPLIDAKQFLQLVAYGEQNEAETLLQKNPHLAQELLRAHNIPFTDYSGRTFHCTAYEYAYWAKDSHMQRMLEKYIRQDEDTRQFILTQAQAIDEFVSPAPGFFNLPKPRGLHYTTQDKQGRTIDHREAHFDLTPLKKALRHYMDEYNKNPGKKSEDDWARINKIWVEEVGRAQREVPAHIAQEYCRPNRPFDVFINHRDYSSLNVANPYSLIRQLKFYNQDTNNDDLWFTPNSNSVDSGLGFAFGIIRGYGNGTGCGDAWNVGGSAVHDLAAIEAIDTVRTKDLQQSLRNLSLPLNVQALSPIA